METPVNSGVLYTVRFLGDKEEKVEILGRARSRSRIRIARHQFGPFSGVVEGKGDEPFHEILDR